MMVLCGCVHVYILGAHDNHIVMRLFVFHLNAMNVNQIMSNGMKYGSIVKQQGIHTMVSN
jgi:hypothetical protein